MEKGPDELIVEALKKKQQIGPSLLVSRYYNALVDAAMEAYGAEQMDAELYASETCRKAVKSIDSFQLRGPSSLWNWLTAILKNTIRDDKRRLQRQEEKVPSPLFNESDLEAFDDEGRLGGVAKEVARAWVVEFEGVQISDDDRKEIIYEVLDSFEPEEQHDIWSYFKGLSHPEIAEMRKATLAGTQKRVNRLVQEFFKRVGKKAGIDWSTIYENYKKQNH
jgi:RNA polymerase sigma factor (sigma-70 family)